MKLRELTLSFDVPETMVSPILVAECGRRAELQRSAICGHTPTTPEWTPR